MMKRWLMLFVLTVFVVSGVSPVAEASKWGDILSGIGKIGGVTGNISRGTVRIAGKITNRKQEPLEGIMITWAGDGGGQVSVNTNSEGNYVMNIPKDTSGKWTVTGENWRTQRHSWRPREDGIYNYTMYHDYLTGKVATLNGVPLQGVKIVFEQDGSVSGIHEIYTDEHGNYRFALPESREYYWVTVSLDGYKIRREHFRFSDEDVWNLTLYEEE